jgi:hypothetical protein
VTWNRKVRDHLPSNRKKNEKIPQKIEPQLLVIFLFPFAVEKALASASLLGCHFI